jgi:DNA-binding transcriptional ArsR family regulator
MARPGNANQLAKELDLDYTTVRHHLDVLIKNDVLQVVGESYGAIFYLSNWLAQKTELLDEILDENRKK